MLYDLVVVVYVIICALLLVVVLLQQGNGDMSAAFGGSSSQTAFGARSGATMLTRATTVMGTLFMVGALAIAILNKQTGGGSVVNGVAAPATSSQPAAPTLPVGPAPTTTAPATTPSATTPGPTTATTPAPATTPAATPPAASGGASK